MKRRSFLKKASVATAGIFAAPYILPGGRLFATSGNRLANHVVVLLLSGGVRNLETVQQTKGNLMPNLLNGNNPLSPELDFAMDFLPTSPLGGNTLQSAGTLFKEFRYAKGPAVTHAARTAAMTGRYSEAKLNDKKSPEYPTLFELYRKHSPLDTNALNAWWVSNSSDVSPVLNHSAHPEYGSLFGANFVQPTSLISPRSHNFLGNARVFGEDDIRSASSIRKTLNKSFRKKTNAGDENDRFENFIHESMIKASQGAYDNPWGMSGAMNNGMYNVLYAEEIIKEFQPELMVVNMDDLNMYSSDFNQYCNNLRKSDFAAAQLWNTIQNTPGMKDDTVLIVVPEHGGEIAESTAAGDQSSREIFCLVAGPQGVVRQNQTLSHIAGESIDIVPTVARVLGFDADIPKSVSPQGRFLKEAFV